ncbi:MAG TPA: tetratricopeptide repeat protein [Terriglobales bacterium]|nr:tetratricopeptide repeat protein [Terriglobales bacterium]
MEDDGKTLPDLGPLSGSGSEAASGPPAKKAGLGTQTPPPQSDISDAPTMAHGSTDLLGSTPAPPMTPVSDVDLARQTVLSPGTVLAGRYRILKVLGQGGMGAVYQARDQELDRVIALKVIRPDLADNPSILQRFKQELILARHVTHKNVVRIYDLGESDGTRFITMEYVEGDDLRTLLRKHGKFSPSQAVEIIQQICRALDAAHSEGVIHRDLKPQTVMRDQQGRVVVMDFGLARLLESPGMTQTGALVGTLEYMSPEQALGEQLDQRSDLFAVGLIFFELLTARSPYKADTGIATLVKRTREAAIPVSQIDSTVPKSLSLVVGRCLERDPNHRYSSAHELLKQLEDWQSDPSTVEKSILHSSAARSVQVSVNLPSRSRLIWAGVALALVLAFFAVPATRHLVFRPSAPGEVSVGNIPPLSQGKFVAVLPLKVLGDEKTLGYVGAGLVDALSAKLFQLQEVHVASASAVDKIASQDLPLNKAAQALGANLILQGTVQGTADKFRVTLDLEDVASGRRVWSDEFSGVPADLLTLEDHIYGNVVAALELKPTNEEMARSGVHPTENSTAYDLYLKGHNALRGSQGTRDTQAAVGFLQDALQQDPNFALAYAGLAAANLRLYRDSKDSLYAQKALASAQKAESLNPNLPEVHQALGGVYNATGRSAEAVEELKKALALAPNSDETYYRLGDAYLASGKKQEAITAYQAAVNSNPYYWYNHNKLGGAYLQTGDNEKALQEYKRVTELAPDNPIGWGNMSAVYMRQGKWAEALPSLEKAITLKPEGADYSNLGFAYFFLKRYNDAVPMFEKAVELSPKDEQLMGNLADSYRWSGKTDQAVKTYDKAIALAYQQLQVNPRAASVMGDLALYYAKKGDATQAQQYIRQARQIDPADLQLIYDQAQVNAIAGAQPEALKALQEAFQKGYSPEEAQNDPEMSKIKDAPEFQAMVREFGKKVQ